jgi:hypothetical protein
MTETETCRHKAQTIKAHIYLHSVFVGYVTTNGVASNARYGTCQGLGRFTPRWKHNIKYILTERGWTVVKICKVQDRDQC